MFCKHFVQTVQTARLPTTKNSTSWQKLSSALTQAFSRADVSVFGPKNHWLLRPQSGPGMLPLWVLQKGNLFDRLHWEKPLPSCPDRNSCNWVPLPGSASEASDGQKGRVTFIKPGCILHAKEWGAGVSKWEWFTEPTLAICKDFIPGSQQGKSDLNLAHRALPEWNPSYHWKRRERNQLCSYGLRPATSHGCQYSKFPWTLNKMQPATSAHAHSTDQWGHEAPQGRESLWCRRKQAQCREDERWSWFEGYKLSGGIKAGF